MELIIMLLVIQNGHIPTRVHTYLDEPYEIVKSFEINALELNLDRYSTIIILGGYQSVTKMGDYPYLQHVVEMIKKCIEIKKPLLGICLGCQLIAYTLGCEIKSSGKLNIGYNAEIMGVKGIFRSHIDYIVPNDSIDIVEYFEDMPYLFKYDNFIYGIQCHPDVPPDYVKTYSSRECLHRIACDNKAVISENNKYVLDTLLRGLKK